MLFALLTVLPLGLMDKGAPNLMNSHFIFTTTHSQFKKKKKKGVSLKVFDDAISTINVIKSQLLNIHL